MLHGNPTWSFHFRALIAGLRDECRTIAMDTSEWGCRRSRTPATTTVWMPGTMQTCGIGRPLGSGPRHHAGDVALAAGGGAGLRRAVPDGYRGWCCWTPAAAFLARRHDGAAALPSRSRHGAGALARPAHAPLSLIAAHVCCKRRPLPPDVRARLLRAVQSSTANRVGILQFVLDAPVAREDPIVRAAVEQSKRGCSDPGRAGTHLLGRSGLRFTPRVLDVWRRHWPQADVHRFADCGRYLVRRRARRGARPGAIVPAPSLNPEFAGVHLC